jgi:hypothetical protein
MDSIPLLLQAGFETLLRKRSVPTNLQPPYKKWLHFYLDFCRKYNDKGDRFIFLFLVKNISTTRPPVC